MASEAGPLTIFCSQRSGDTLSLLWPAMTEPPQMKEPTARNRIYLRGTSPENRRWLDVPHSTKLLLLHDLIQIAIEWADCEVVKTEILHFLKILPTEMASECNPPTCLAMRLANAADCKDE